jgi:3-deoxy-D-manno-octulosonic acid kinase
MEHKEHRGEHGHWFLFRQDIPVTLHPQIFSPTYWQAQGSLTGSAKGRGTTVFIRPKATEEWALRHYRRGGMIGRMLTDQFLYTGLNRTRAWQEFHLLEYMRHHGLSVPEPVAAHVWRTGCYYQADLITRLIPDSHDLHKLLSERTLSKEEWRKAGQAIARLHQHQVYHHDLNIRNLMLDEQGNIWIIDFDKCRLRAGNNWQKQNLERLHRSLKKSAGNQSNWYWQETDFETLLEAYSDTYR